MVAGRGEENESGGLWGLGRWEEGWVVLTYYAVNEAEQINFGLWLIIED